MLHKLCMEVVMLLAAGVARSPAVAALQQCRLLHHMDRTSQAASSTNTPDSRSP